MPILVILSFACSSETLDGARVVRLIEPPPDSRSMAGVPRARLGNESRYVMSSVPQMRLADSLDVELPREGPLHVEVEIPRELHDARELVVEGWIHAGDRGFEPPPVYTDPQLREGSRLSLAFPVPEAFRGKPAVLSLTGHRLDSARREDLSKEFVVPDNAWLRFGYGVAPVAWARGWPAVRFRVYAIDSTAPEGEQLLFEGRADPVADARDRGWLEASIDLGRFAGREIRIRFEAEPVSSDREIVIPRALGLVANPRIVVRSRSPRIGGGELPNVVLVSIDTLRAKSVGAYGARRATTPTFDTKVAAAGALVRHAVTPFPHTTPAHMSMFTGLEPCAHGVLTTGSGLSDRQMTLAEALRANGYRTAAFTEDGAIADGMGYERGFDRYTEMPPDTRVGRAFETFAEARSWISEPSPAPFFAFIHTYEVHAPYTPRRGYEEFFRARRAGEWATKELAYDRAIRYMDDVLDDFIAFLDGSGLGNDLLLVITADHGEEFMEHGTWAHGNSLFDEGLLVPLGFRFPGRISPGTVVEAQVGLIDLAPTILDLAGVPQFSEVQGQSFAALLRGKNKGFVERPVHSLDLKGNESIRTGRYKYYQRGGRELVFELTTDPDEGTNAARTHPLLLREGRRALEQARQRCEAWKRQRGAASSGGISGKRQGELWEKLKALGYVAD